MILLLTDIKKLLKTIGCLVIVVFLFTHATAFAGEKVYFYHNDAAGTAMAITDQQGNVVWRKDYKPFGEEQSTTGTIENNRQFIGKELDVETGLIYINHRYYSPELGRFITADPIGPVNPWNSKTNYEMLLNPQRLNPYAYGLNNPYRYIDKDGQDAILIKYIGYQVNTGLGFKLPLGHSAVVAVDPNTGLTKYYEYGRYDKAKFGEVRTRKIPNVTIGEDDQPTEKSLKNLYNEISKQYGQSKPVDATYYEDADFQRVVDFATDRMNDKNRKPYSLVLHSNNCKTFATEAIEAGRKEERFYGLRAI